MHSMSSPRFAPEVNVAAEGASGIVQAAREQFDLDAGDLTYTVEQWVMARQMLRLREGAPVQFVVSGKKLILKTSDGKTRNMKVIAMYPKKPPG